MHVRLWAVATGFAVLAACQSERGFYEQNGSDVWNQAPTNQVDILFVVDDSCSMQEEQAALAAGFSTFTGQLEDSLTDFHIGVITTSFDYQDPDRGKLLGDPTFLTNTDDYATAFTSRAQVGVAGSDKEKGLEAAEYALSPVMQVGANAGFLRSAANLLVIFVSDEEDCSDEGALTGQEAETCYTKIDQLVPVSEYVVAFRDLKDDPTMIQVGSIVGVDTDSCQGVYPGRRYMELVQLTGGLIGDICDADWSGMMGQLGLNATGVLSSFQLSNGAKDGTLEVFVDGEQVPESATEGWTYDGETWYIHFADAAVPPRGAVIEALYVIAPGEPRPPGVEEPEPTPTP